MTPDPAFLATAVEAVVRAGEIHLSKFRSGVRIEKKGAIDLVTEVDLEVERMFRAMVAERFPDHDVLAEEMGGVSTGARCRWVFDPLDGTTNYAHGLPIFCASLALEIDGQPEVAAIYDANRKELFTAERGVGRVAERRADDGLGDRDDSRSAAGHRVSLHRAPDAGADTSRCSAPSSRARVPFVVLVRRRWTSATWRRAAWTGSGKRACSPGTPWQAG